MKCKDVLEFAVAFVEGSTTELMARAMKDHLASCSACSAFIEDIRAQVEWLRDSAIHDAPEDSWKKLQQSMAQEPRRMAIRRFRITASIFGSVAAAVVLVVASFTVFSKPPKYFDVTLQTQLDAFDPQETSKLLQDSSSTGGAVILSPMLPKEEYR